MGEETAEDLDKETRSEKVETQDIDIKRPKHMLSLRQRLWDLNAD